MEGDSGRMKRRREENWVKEEMTGVMRNTWLLSVLLLFLLNYCAASVKTQKTSIVPGTTHAYTKLFGLTDTKAHKEGGKSHECTLKVSMFSLYRAGLANIQLHVHCCSSPFLFFCNNICTYASLSPHYSEHPHWHKVWFSHLHINFLHLPGQI